MPKKYKNFYGEEIDEIESPKEEKRELKEEKYETPFSELPPFEKKEEDIVNALTDTIKHEEDDATIDDFNKKIDLSASVITKLEKTGFTSDEIKEVFGITVNEKKAKKDKSNNGVGTGEKDKPSDTRTIRAK